MNDLVNLLIKNGLPLLGQAVAGPLGGAALAFLASKLGLSDQTTEAMQNAISGMKPEQLVDLKRLDIEFQEHMADNGLKIELSDRDLLKEQIKTNQIEAAKPGYFNGWRPAVGWVCVAILGLSYIPKALALTLWWSVQAYLTFAHPDAKLPGLPPFPDMGLTDVLGILGTLLGSAYMAKLRTDEKAAETAKP